ncbi:MAG: hypothetical protein U0133_12125 [Gemmatimonadales bacterium]
MGAKSIAAVVKIGGGLTRLPGALERVGGAVARAAVRCPLVVVPGGGPFANQVRAFDREHRLSADAAHWMAILGMDQYAWALVERIPGAQLVEDLAGIQQAHESARVPVLAPARWLRAADELPHAWEVTSDSLAAYLATLTGAERLVLVKPAPGGRELLDPWFEKVVPAGVRWSVVGADETERLEQLLGESSVQ